MKLRECYHSHTNHVFVPLSDALFYKEREIISDVIDVVNMVAFQQCSIFTLQVCSEQVRYSLKWRHVLLIEVAHIINAMGLGM